MAVLSVPPSSDNSVTVAAPPSPVPQVQSASINQQIPNPAPQLQTMSNLPMQYQPTVPTGGDKWHQAVRALLGTSTQYRPSDPNNPNSSPVPYEVQNKPGQLFRSILAGAILGAGAGTANAEHNAGSGWGAAGAGAAAAQKGAQQQQQQRQQQAQQQFENQQKVEQQNQEEVRRKAEIALNNAQTLRINQELQGTDFDQHVKVANIGRASVQPFEDAGIAPVAQNLSESQMHQYVQDHPEATAYDWEPVSVKTVMTKDKDGNEVPTYESVYAAYDPKGKVTVPQKTLDEWKQAGVFDRYPEYEAALSNNKVLPASVYVQVKGHANQVIADNLAKDKQKQETVMDQAKIDLVKAQIKRENAGAYNENMSAQEKKDAKDKQAALDTAWSHLAAAGNDPSKDPMTAQDRVTIARNAQPLIQDSLNAIKTAAADPSQQDQLPQLWDTYHSLARLAQLGGSGPQPDMVSVTTADGKTGQIPKDKVDAFLKANPGATTAGSATAGSAYAPTDKILVKRPDGSTTTTTKAEYDRTLQENPGIKMTIVSKVPTAPEPSYSQTLAGLNLTATQ